MILKEISRFVKEENQEARSDEIALFYSDLENLTFNKTFLTLLRKRICRSHLQL